MDEESLMKGKISEKNFVLMFKTLRRILNEERANRHYTTDQIKSVMDLVRTTLTKVMLDD